MKRLLRWWRGRKWVYLGQTKLNLVTYNANIKDEKGNPSVINTEVEIIQFYAWQNSMKCRKFVISENDTMARFKKDVWYHEHIVPWLEGGDIWKPIKRPIAVQGNLVNFYNGKSQP